MGGRYTPVSPKYGRGPFADARKKDRIRPLLRSVTPAAAHRSCAQKEEEKMASSRIALAVAGAVSLSAAAAALANPMVGGAPMYSTRNIVQNAVNSKDHTTLVAAVKVGGLV